MAGRAQAPVICFFFPFARSIIDTLGNSSATPPDQNLVLEMLACRSLAGASGQGLSRSSALRQFVPLVTKVNSIPDRITIADTMSIRYSRDHTWLKKTRSPNSKGRKVAMYVGSISGLCLWNYGQPTSVRRSRC